MTSTEERSDGVIRQKSSAGLKQPTPAETVKQKLIFDEESFEQSFLRCFVCRDRYCMDLIPLLLPCHHSFCYNCIVKLYEQEVAKYKGDSSSSTPYAVSVSCPVCSSRLVTTQEGLGQLKRDHRIIQLLDFVGHTDKHTINYCSKHTVMPLNFFCEPCVQPVCRDCTVIDHKSSSDHFVLDINAALKKYTPVIEEGISKMEDDIKFIQKNREEVAEATSKVQKKHEDLRKVISESFDRLRAALNERESELKEMTETNAVESKGILEEKLKILTEKERTIADSVKSLEKSKADGQVEDLFKIYQTVREYKTEPPMKTSEIEAATEATTTFTGSNEALLLSRIGSYGEISTSSTTSASPGSSSRSYNPNYGTSSSSDRSYSTGSAYSSYGGTGSRYGSSSTTSLYGNRYGQRSYRY